MVDPQRDVDPYLEAAEAHGARLAYVLETHVHNDYVSGGLELARRSGATLVLPDGSGAAFAHRSAGDGARLEANDLRVSALRTPGHTPEHTAYLVETSADRRMLFSGGSLLAGSAGRTDLAGAAWTDRLTASQFVSVRRLAALAPDTVLYPTHGAGSFCTASAPTGAGFSTIGQERTANPALADDDPLGFARRQLRGLLRYPAYYSHMAPINRAGPVALGTVVAPPVLDAASLASLRSAGIAVVDARPRARFAEAHIPGSLHVELDESFGTYVGWLLPFDTPLALVVERADDGREAALQLARIGYDRVRGMLVGAGAWTDSGRATASHRRSTPAGLREALRGEAPPLVLDVRQPAEWEDGVIPGSIQRFVADLGDVAEWLPTDRPVWTVCQGGYRSAMAASILAAEGYDVTSVDGGGVAEVLRG